MKFHDNFKKNRVFVVILQNIGIFTFLNTRNAILMTTLSVSITFEYVITIWFSDLQLLSELIQSKSALFNA